MAGDCRQNGGMAEGQPIFTIGHSTHPIDVFIGLLHRHGVELLVDLRTVPRSRHNPQFEQDALAASLPAAAIAYGCMKALGGLRRPRPDSENTGWRNTSFRGYADYMQTEAFERALDELIALAARQPTVIMCAESLPWRCHRSLVGDALLVRGIEVIDILSNGTTRPQSLTRFARAEGTRITYPPEEPTLPL